MRHGPELEIGHKAIARRITLYVINWLLEPEKAVMLQTVSRLLPELPLFLITAVATHLVMSFAQTLMHYKLGHHPMGGKFFPQPHQFPSRPLFQRSSRLTDLPR